MHLSMQQVEQLESVMSYEMCKFRSYSGRGMYGKKCLGFVGSIREFSQLIADLTDGIGLDEMSEWMGDVQLDSMGLSTIFYWPNLSVDDEIINYLESNYGDE